MSENIHPFHNVLSLPTCLPLEVRRIEAVDEIQWQRLLYRNTLLLEIVLQSQSQPVREGEEGRENQDIRRLDVKLDFLMSLMGQTQNPAVITAGNIHISENGLSYTQPTKLLPRQLLHLRLFISPRYQHPLELAATVCSCVQRSDQYEVTAVFLPLPEDLKELLAKLIFQMHRHHVAKTRKNKK
ncbi:MAG: PilZ domain-containing protein [Gammaproteobacteria bacterium]|nr:PilZ domain-containing protein [Gammaproteobacteria bacterium]MDH5801318.1 PilZ domain-containing protein [Gammaproteobacteria bacterium]